MKIIYFLHAQPTELGSANGAHHVVAGAVVHLHDQYLAPGARFYVIP